MRLSVKRLALITGILLLAGLAAFAWSHKKEIIKDYYGLRVALLRREVLAQERRHIRNVPAHQILFELEWIYGKTGNYARVRERLAALNAALKDSRNFDAVDEQSPADGSWGHWYTEWFFKLIATRDQVASLAGRNELPKYPVRLLDRINSPEKLTAHLNALLTSYREVDGVDRRWELNETISDLMRLILRGQPANYPFHPELKAALMDWLINTARNPETGYWGERYQRKGVLTKTNDISITFHVVSYLNGQVPDWPKIIDTTLAIKGVRLGWFVNGRYSNHDNVDVAELFRLGWKHASPSQRDAIRVEIQQMLAWCLKQSLRPDGSFTVDQESIESSEYFGASFLARIGYFDRRLCFWSDQGFSRAAEDRERIIRFIRANYRSGGESGGYYRGALRQIGDDDVAQELESASLAGGQRHE
jgi:hypothetical protein